MINPLKKVEVNRFVMRHPKVSESLRGFRIGQITDIHFGPWVKTRHLDEIVEFVNSLDCAVVALTGDYVGYNKRTLGPCAQSLSKLKGDVFAVLGNHDHWASTEFSEQCFREAQIPLLRNEGLHITHNDQRVQIVGVDDAVTNNADVEAAFAEIDPDLFCLTLNHVPSIAWDCSDAGANLILSGHTHGFQFNIPRVTNALAERFGTQLFAGPYRLEDAILYISRGIGSASWPRRIRATPELTFFDLQPGDRPELELVRSDEVTMGRRSRR